ncbi:outer membrane beta-barrel protein [uncultured Fibrobacter sp.]|uniref:outer membrane beta-barrel protein n=1 Tax=uncultured Fibrobacter sp. TaxID=261512 RepID=UPI0025EB7738|nr:outer membrane beta-barrel protein [uncultured Fibrobacter sp.]
MDLKRLCVILATAFALSVPAMAQDDSSDDEGWATAPSAESTSENDAPAYDGSTDSEFANDEEYASAYARYKAETTKKSEINRMRNEGFARAVMLGIRAQVGTNTLFGENSDGWKMGFQVGGGLMLKMNFMLKDLSLVPELTFNYRHYVYEKDMNIYTNTGSIDIFIFDIPIIFRYTFEDYNFYVGLGLNMGLKLNGTSEFKNGAATESQDNTISTSGMEVGGAFDLGYMLTRWVHVNIRVVQCFTSLSNKSLMREDIFLESSLKTFYTTVGVSFLF